MKKSNQTERRVVRVLVMLDYGPDDPCSGEVFDLTALSLEAGKQSEYQHATIELSVDCRTDYGSADRPTPTKTEVSWRASVNFNSSGKAAYLDDAINAALPDSFATQDLRKKLERVQNKAEQLAADIQVQRLLDAAAIRAQHPIARVQEPALLSLPQAS